MYYISITLLASLDNKNGSCAVREVKKPSPQIYLGPILEGYAFDRATLVTVLGEIPDQEKALLEIYQVLVPGGLLSITELLPDPHFQSRKKVTRLAARTGFTVEPVYASWRSYTLNLVKAFKSKT